MQSETVHFVVTGEFITEKARDFWNDEDDPERALTLLESVRGLSESQRLDVIEGRSKLIGDSSKGIQIVPDQKKGKVLKEIVKKLKAERDEARDERDDLVQMAIGDTVGFGSPTGLRQVPRRKTEQRTYSGTRQATLGDYEFDDVLADPETPVVAGRGTKPLRIWTQSEPSGYFRRLSEGGGDPEDDEPEEEEKRPAPPPAEDKIRRNDSEGAQGWVSPEGKFYPCGYAQHALTAWKLGLTDNPQNHSIEISGWARLGVTGGEQYFFGEHVLFGEKVRATIKAYCLEQKIELPYWLREEA